VGKSSLLTRLAGSDAAMVTAVPGTTRDTIERQIEIGGIPLTVIDTAGLRETEDEVERHGIARTRAAIERADVALVLVDARDDDRPAAMNSAVASELMPTLPRIVVHNKSDLAFAVPHVERFALALDDGETEATHVWICALTGEGVALLEAEILRIAGVSQGVEDAFFARARQLAALDAANSHLAEAADRLRLGNATLELFAEELKQAQNAFSSITGEFTADDLLGEIFSRFCIGK
jgi:tRNA modification GTPase